MFLQSAWPHRAALSMALGIYRDAMRQFIYIRMKEIHGAGNVEIRIKEDFLAEQAELGAYTDQEGRSLSERFEESTWLNGGDVANALEIDMFHALVDANRPSFAATFRDFNQGLYWMRQARRARNKVAHPSSQDLSMKSTLENIEFLSKLLACINEIEAKRAVDDIGERLVHGHAIELDRMGRFRQALDIYRQAMRRYIVNAVGAILAADGLIVDTERIAAKIRGALRKRQQKLFDEKLEEYDHSIQAAIDLNWFTILVWKLLIQPSREELPQSDLFYGAMHLIGKARNNVEHPVLAIEESYLRARLNDMEFVLGYIGDYDARSTVEQISDGIVQPKRGSMWPGSLPFHCWEEALAVVAGALRKKWLPQQTGWFRRRAQLREFKASLKPKSRKQFEKNVSQARGNLEKAIANSLGSLFWYDWDNAVEPLFPRTKDFDPLLTRITCRMWVRNDFEQHMSGEFIGARLHDMSRILTQLGMPEESRKVRALHDRIDPPAQTLPRPKEQETVAQGSSDTKMEFHSKFSVLPWVVVGLALLGLAVIIYLGKYHPINSVYTQFFENTTQPKINGSGSDTDSQTSKVLQRSSLRSGPGESYPLVGHLEANEEFLPVAITGDLNWILLDTGKWLNSQSIAGARPILPVWRKPTEDLDSETPAQPGSQHVEGANVNSMACSGELRRISNGPGALAELRNEPEWLMNGTPLQPGTPVCILNRSGTNWVYAQALDGRQGWLHDRFELAVRSSNLHSQDENFERACDSEIRFVHDAQTGQAELRTEPEWLLDGRPLLPGTPVCVLDSKSPWWVYVLTPNGEEGWLHEDFELALMP